MKKIITVKEENYLELTSKFADLGICWIDGSSFNETPDENLFNLLRKHEVFALINGWEDGDAIYFEYQTDGTLGWATLDEIEREETEPFTTVEYNQGDAVTIENGQLMVGGK